MNKLTLMRMPSFYKSLCCVLFCLMQHGMLWAQLPETGNTEQQLENLTAGNADEPTEDDGFLQQMQQYLQHPINLNTADEASLAELKLLTPLQINSLLSYRAIMGKFISIYELQAVPDWDIATIQRLRLYVTVSNPLSLMPTLRKRLSGGNHSLLLRASQVLEKARGFEVDTVADNLYKGSPQKIFMRYRYAYKNLLQYGMVGEKDAGEQFFKGKQRLGFDFYSAHLFVRNMGPVQALALGDFTVNLGQGLTQWQGLAFKKGADVINIKRQSAVLRPYNSAGEANFQRGFGITLHKKHWQLTLFASRKKMDANGVVDSFANNEAYVSALQTSGYHRTNSELADKGVQQATTWGGNINWQQGPLQLGINMVQHRFALPLVKANEPYNYFAFSGKQLVDQSLHYSYTYKNAHFFGELAVGNGKSKALVSGLLVSVAPQVDMALLYRHIAQDYPSINANAFTESSLPNNEQGLYTGMSIRPSAAWRLDAYIDVYRFPWLRYRVDAPSYGTDTWVQATYKPNKELEIYSRYRSESKAGNASTGEAVLTGTVVRPKQNWRTQVNYRLTKALMVRSRAEMVWYDKKGPDAGQGFLIFADLLYKPMLRPFSAGLRLQYFEASDYNARLYAYENDVLYSFSIPVFYNKGVRWYLNLHYDLGKKWSFWARIAQTNYRNMATNGSGLDAIKSNRKTEIKLQLAYDF
jgi:Helix-hairpin-helix motif